MFLVDYDIYYDLLKSSFPKSMHQIISQTHYHHKSSSKCGEKCNIVSSTNLVGWLEAGRLNFFLTTSDIHEEMQHPDDAMLYWVASTRFRDRDDFFSCLSPGFRGMYLSPKCFRLLVYRV